ncbi:MAG: 30S ribosomal protein S18 [Patescibacteria group bacterium]
MAGKKKTTNRKPVERKAIGGCYFCKNDKIPDYKDFESLDKYISDRAKISSRGRSGLCAKHQRRLAQSIKRARHLALLPFTGRI